MSLADALLADLDGLSDDGGPSDHDEPQPQASSSSSKPSAGGFGAMLPPPVPAKALNSIGNGNGNAGKRPAAALEDDLDEDMGGDGNEGEDKLENGMSAVGYVPEGGVRPADELDADEVEKTDMAGVEDVGKVAKLLSGKKLKEVIKVGLVLFFSEKRPQ